MKPKPKPPEKKRAAVRANPDTRTAQRARRRPGQRLTAAERPGLMGAFLRAFADCGNIRQASKAIGISRTTVYDWRDRDVDGFNEKFRLANLDVDDMLEGEMLRRGFKGVEEPVYQGGKRVGSIRKYSDRLLEMLVKARIPKYRDVVKIDIAEKVRGMALDAGLTEEDAEAAVREAVALTRGRP